MTEGFQGRRYKPNRARRRWLRRQRQRAERAQPNPEIDTFLEEYEEEEAWCEEHKISRRTAARHRNRTNGLPFLEWGGKIYIPRVEGQDYIDSLVKRPDPARRERRR
jgi:hypothetical protein